MNLASISIANMAAFASFEAKLPSIVLIQGKNGEGKTSFLDCVKYALGRGHNEDMIHGDAPEGEIVIELDNGAAIKCRAIREKHETIRAWRAPGSKRFVVSREQIDAIAAAVSYDPLAFLEKPEKEQVETLLRIMPIQCGDEEIAAALGDVAVEQPAALHGNALERIDYIRKKCYDRRRDLNVAADTQEKHAKELEKALPPTTADGTNWRTETERLAREKAALDATRAEQLSKIKAVFDGEKQAAQEEYMATVKAVGEARDARVEEARRQTNEAIKKVQDDYNARLRDLDVGIGTAQERAHAQTRAQGTLLALDEAKKQASELRESSHALTGAIERLDALKTAVAARLPIPGITVQDGRILREENGNLIPFSRWNTEAKMRFCLRIAVLAHADCAFICLDGAERFDSDKRAALLKTAQRYAETDGLQFLITTVADRPLTVSAPGE